MSKQKQNQKPGGRAKKAAPASPNTGRRKFIVLGTGAAIVAVGGGVGYKMGWFGGGGASHASALDAANAMLEQHAREIANPSCLVHAVRGFGKGFKLADGSNAVEHLCSRYAADREVNGKRYVYFKRDAEVHENSFLKTFLEAGVSLDQPVMVGETRYTLRDVADSGKALFRCNPQDLFKYDAVEFRYDPVYREPQAPGQPPATTSHGELVHEHLPWGLIAFTLLMKPEQASWTNAYGEAISLPVVIDGSLAEYETTCALGERDLEAEKIAPKPFRDAIKKYSCFGMHSVYAFLSCVNHGYRNNGLPERITRMMDLVTYRLKGDAQAIDADYAAESQGVPPELVEAFRVRALIKLYGHAFEAINYAKLHKLVNFTAEQQQRIGDGEQALYNNLVKMRGMDWGMLKNKLGEKFTSDIVIAIGHATRALKLLTPQNPDTLA